MGESHCSKESVSLFRTQTLLSQFLDPETNFQYKERP